MPPPGSLLLDSTSESITPNMPYEAFAALRAAPAGRVHLSPGATRCQLPTQSLSGTQFDITAVFENDRLARLELTARQPADKGGWSSWTHDSEMRRKALHESWAAGAFSRPLEIKPYILEDHPDPIYPHDPGPEHPRHALFDWGEVISSYDSKAGFAVLIIDYRKSLTAPPGS